MPAPLASILARLVPGFLRSMLPRGVSSAAQRARVRRPAVPARAPAPREMGLQQRFERELQRLRRSDPAPIRTQRGPQPPTALPRPSGSVFRPAPLAAGPVPLAQRPPMPGRTVTQDPGLGPLDIIHQAEQQAAEVQRKEQERVRRRTTATKILVAGMLGPFGLAVAIKKITERLVESRRELGKFNANIAIGNIRLEQQQLRFARRRAAVLGPSTRQLQESLMRLREGTEPMRLEITRALQEGFALVTNDLANAISSTQFKVAASLVGKLIADQINNALAIPRLFGFLRGDPDAPVDRTVPVEEFLQDLAAGEFSKNRKLGPLE